MQGFDFTSRDAFAQSAAATMAGATHRSIHGPPFNAAACTSFEGDPVSFVLWIAHSNGFNQVGLTYEEAYRMAETRADDVIKSPDNMHLKRCRFLFLCDCCQSVLPDNYGRKGMHDDADAIFICRYCEEKLKITRKCGTCVKVKHWTEFHNHQFAGCTACHLHPQ